MNLHDYQGAINDFARYPQVHSKRYCALGLFGEAGEIANQVKKIWRDDDAILTEDRKVKLRDELGDVLWYAVRFAHHYGLVVGTFTIQIGASASILGLPPTKDIFEATERLGVLTGIVMATSVSPEPLDEGDLQELVSDLLNAIADVADQLDTDIETVAGDNVAKLTGRVERGTLQGSGDGR